MLKFYLVKTAIKYLISKDNYYSTSSLKTMTLKILGTFKSFNLYSI